MTAAFPYLDLAIGLAFIYLLMALICTTLNESLAGILNSRGKTLAQGITDLLLDPELQQKVYAHPLIRGVQQGNEGRLPSYLASNRFALALTDILTGAAPANDPEALRRGVEALTNPQTKQVLQAVLADNTTLKGDQQRIEAWYEENMYRVSGWYKRLAQIRVFIFAALVTLLLNADTMKILKVLWYNPTISALVVEDAKARQEHGLGTPSTANQPANAPVRAVITPDEEARLAQITGWSGDWYDDWRAQQKPSDQGASGWLLYLVKQRLVGWLITIMAISLGAPFWFDILSKIMNLRNAGTPPPKLLERLQAEKPTT